MGKIQGEGDYESARRYNKHTEQSVKQGAGKTPTRVPDNERQELEQAERAGKKRAKQLDHDAKDADVMRQPVGRDSTH